MTMRAWWVPGVAAGIGVVAAITTALTAPNVPLVVTTNLATAVAGVAAVVVGVLSGAVALGAVARRRREALDRVRAEGDAAAVLREQQAHDAARARSMADRARLLGRIDHELKNPVMATNLAVARLRAAEPGSADAAEALDTIDAQAQRFATLLVSLRKLAEIEHRALDLESVDIAEALAAALDAVRAQVPAEERSWRVIVPQVPWPLPLVVADPDLLHLALANLVDNAVKYTRPGDHIELRATESDGGVLIEVADTGAGIPEAEVGAVWEELTRASTARGVPGQGVGLALVRSVVGRHGGHVSLRSRVGEGTSVAVWLPSHPDSSRRSTP